MKKLVCCILALSIALLAGCAQSTPQKTADVPPVESTQPAETTPKQTIEVSTVDEFLAALGSDREIILAPGTYDLTTATDYGRASVGSPYHWDESLDGYELVIDDFSNLTIRGSGKDQTTILTRPRYSNVLRFRGTINLLLEDFTAGHTQTGQMCTGGVIFLDNTTNTTIRETGLYGCGTIGVDAYNAFNTHISHCDIYECSFGGVALENCTGAAVENTTFHDIGTLEDFANSIFNFYCSSDLAVRNCTIQDNFLFSLIALDDSPEVRLENNSFRNNRLENSGFLIHGKSPMLDGNTFEDTQLRKWYSRGSDLAVDAQGKAMEESAFPAIEAPAQSTVDQKQVKAATVDEFLAAIAPNTEIVLDTAFYDLSSASDYGTGNTDYYSWIECFDGYQLVIHDVDNLTITTSDGNVKAHTISATPRYADVLRFERCRNGKISGFTAGHTIEPGSCTGGVIFLDNCDNMTVDNCGLFGCGILGVEAENCAGINVLNSEIYECSNGGIRMWETDNINIDKTTFRDLGGEELMFLNCRNITVDGKPYSEK